VHKVLVEGRWEEAIGFENEFREMLDGKQIFGSGTCTFNTHFNANSWLVQQVNP